MLAPTLPLAEGAARAVRAGAAVLPGGGAARGLAARGRAREDATRARPHRSGRRAGGAREREHRGDARFPRRGDAAAAPDARRGERGRAPQPRGAVLVVGVLRCDLAPRDHRAGLRAHAAQRARHVRAQGGPAARRLPHAALPGRGARGAPRRVHGARRGARRGGLAARRAARAWPQAA
eukprot:scaffold14308_cov68-Phaeocystis_antarctica.AAC.10